MKRARFRAPFTMFLSQDQGVGIWQLLAVAAGR